MNLVFTCIHQGCLYPFRSFIDKNENIHGHNRTDFVVAKLILSLFLNLMLNVAYVLIK